SSISIEAPNLLSSDGERVGVRGSATSLYTPARFAHVPLSDRLTDFLRQNPQSHSRTRLNRLLLEAAYPEEIAKSSGGLYPDRVIMKVNRQPLTSIPADILDRDHEFWKQYSRRLTGDIIDYGTSVQQIARWIEKTYVRYDFDGFTGDRKFIHDIDAQKSFSKLRSAIAGVYLWRFSPQCPPEYRPRTNAEFQRLVKEAKRPNFSSAARIR